MFELAAIVMAILNLCGVVSGTALAIVTLCYASVRILADIVKDKRR